MNNYKREVKRKIWAATNQLEKISNLLRFGKGLGTEKHSEWERLATQVGLAKWETYEGNHGQDYTRLDETPLGEKMEGLLDEIDTIAEKLEEIADSIK